MDLKQENAIDNSSEVIQGITNHFQAMNLPLLAKPDTYQGMPFPILEKFYQTLTEQRKRNILTRLG